MERINTEELRDKATAAMDHENKEVRKWASIALGLLKQKGHALVTALRLVRSYEARHERVCKLLLLYRRAEKLRHHPGCRCKPCTDLREADKEIADYCKGAIAAHHEE